MGGHFRRSDGGCANPALRENVPSRLLRQFPERRRPSGIAHRATIQPPLQSESKSTNAMGPRFAGKLPVLSLSILQSRGENN
jgi:hypothetical protein